MSSRMIFFYLALHLIAFNLRYSNAQSKNLRSITGLGSTEVFDLLTDNKGFLWVAHAGGVSKFDGINFTNYYSPEQSSLKCSGLLEDKYGRIWFYNFTGQIFYIYKGRMNLLTAYDAKNEPDYPNFGIFKDMLVATTKKGLFICALNTLKCHYETCNNLPANGTTSLSIFKDEVVVFGYRKWFLYKPGNGLKPAHFSRTDSLIINEDEGNLTTRTFNDTAFMPCNPGRVVYKITVANDRLKVCGVQHFKYFINSVYVLRNEYWINTSRSSFKFPEEDSVADHDLVCETIDKQGHFWYGSEHLGLVSDLTNTALTKNEIMLPMTHGDIINCLAVNGNNLLIGTGYGKLIKYDPRKRQSSVLTKLLPKHNGIKYIKMLNSDNAILGSSDHTFIFSLSENKVLRTYRYLVMRQEDTIHHSMIFATDFGLIALPFKDNPVAYNSWKNSFNYQFKGFEEYVETDGPYRFLDYKQRTLAVCSFPKTNTIWVGLKNGLCKINNAGVTPVYVNNLPVFTSCLATFNEQVIAGTINNGLFIFNGKQIKHLSTTDGLLSNNVVQIKVTGTDLLVYDGGLLQVFDAKTFKLVDKYQLPGINDGVFTDAEELNGQLFFASSNRLYAIQKEISNNQNTQICTINFTVNAHEIDIRNDIKLRHDQNEIGINLGIPSPFNAPNVMVKYRLSLKNHNAKWLYSKVGERNFKFEALSPGAYVFEASAGRLQLGVSGVPIVISFTIMAPWWQTWEGIGGMIVTGSFLVFIFLRLYYNSIIAAKKTEFERKLAIETERERISSDMHDEIGASLSALKLYTGAALKSGNATGGIPQIYKMVSDLSDKTREVIWSLNKIHDNVESLICFIESTANRLFEHSDIKLGVTVPDQVLVYDVNSDKRHNIYLVVKEALHNILKHSGASEAWLSICVIKGCLSIKIQDNGVGIALSRNSINGQGLANMKKRARELGGSITIKSTEGTNIILNIPLED